VPPFGWRILSFPEKRQKSQLFIGISIGDNPKRTTIVIGQLPWLDMSLSNFTSDFSHDHGHRAVATSSSGTFL
jgi:hypothetical protein